MSGLELILGLLGFAIAWAIRGGKAPSLLPTTPSNSVDSRDRDDTLDLAVQLQALGLGSLAPLVQAVAVGNFERVKREMDSLWSLVLSDDRTKLAAVRQRIVELQRAEAALAVKIENPEALPAADQVVVAKATTRRTRA